MGAPKEVWVNSYGWHPNGVVYAYRLEVEAERCLQDGGTMARYVLARPKRDAVAWVVRHSDGDYLGQHGRWCPRVLAARYATAAEASRSIPAACDARVVKLVRPVKP